MQKLKHLLEAFRLIFDVYTKPEKYITAEEMEATLVEAKVEALIQQAEKLQKKKPDDAYHLYQQVVEYIEDGIASDDDTTDIEYSLVNSVEGYASSVLENDTSNQMQLENALSFTDLGVKYGFELVEEDSYRDPWNFMSFWNVRVALLSKLGRQTSTYPIVQKMLEYDTDPYEYSAIHTIFETPEFRQSVTNFPAIFDEQARKFIQKSQHILANIPITVFPKNIDKTNKNVRYDVIDLNEAVKKYQFINLSYSDTPKTLVINGDFYCEQTIDEAWIRNQAKCGGVDDTSNIEGVLFTGHLYVDNDIRDNESLLLQVMQDVYVSGNVFSYDGAQVFKGDAYIRLGIYGEYNHGYVEVGGKLFTPYLIASDHAMPRNADQDSIYIEGGNGDDKFAIEVGKSLDGDVGWGWQYFKSSYRLLKPDVWNDEDEFSVAQFFNMIRQGKNPFIEIWEE